MNYTEQLERETERTRVELANTVEELRERLTPGEVLDEVIDYASDGEIGDYLRNFGRQVVDNPLPLGLIGVSVAWLIAASAFGGRRNNRWLRETTDERMRVSADLADDARGARRSFARRADDIRTRAADRASDLAGRTAEQTSDFAARAANRAGDFASRAADHTGDLADRAADTAGDMADRARDMAGRAADQATTLAGQASDRMADVAGQANAAAGRVGDRMRSAASTAGANLAAAGDGLTDSARSSARAIGDAATEIARSGRSASRAVGDFGRQQPLIVAATGLVLGAIIGALLPSTELEDELVGETSDAAKDKLREMAGEQYEKAKDIAERTVETALNETGVSASSRDRGEQNEAREFGPGPGDHGHAEQPSDDHSAGTQEAEHTRAGGA